MGRSILCFGFFYVCVLVLVIFSSSKGLKNDSSEFPKHSEVFLVLFVGSPSAKIRQKLIVPLLRCPSQEVDSDLLLYQVSGPDTPAKKSGASPPKNISTEAR